jgi:hypothetical protein
MTASLIRRAVATPRVQIKKDRLFWEPSKSLRALGYKGVALGIVTSENLNAADELNTSADRQLAEGTASSAPATLGQMIDRYQSHAAYRAGIRDSTRRHYARHLARARTDMGAKRVEQITASVVRGWHDKLAATSARDAYNHLGTLRALFSWGIEQGQARSNPAASLRIASPARRKRVGTRDELWAMVRAADLLGRPSVAIAAILITATMQRPGDALSFTADQVQDGALFFTQSKTGAALNFRLHPVAADRLGPISGNAPLIRSETTASAYGERAFERAWAAVRKEAAKELPSLIGGDASVREATLKGALNASDLRRTGMVWAAQSGALIPDICSVSGHSIKRGMEILETYLPRQRLLADRAVGRLNMVRTPELEEIAMTMLQAA